MKITLSKVMQPELLYRFLKDVATLLSPSPRTWTSATLLNSWVAYGAPYALPGYMNDPINGVGHLKGMAKSGTLNSVLFTLPTGNRPTSDAQYVVPCNGATCLLEVRANGDVIQIGGASNASISLSGVNFRTA